MCLLGGVDYEERRGNTCKEKRCHRAHMLVDGVGWGAVVPLLLLRHLMERGVGLGVRVHHSLPAKVGEGLMQWPGVMREQSQRRGCLSSTPEGVTSTLSQQAIDQHSVPG